MKVAAIQMTSGPDIAENIREAEKYIREAAAQGAEFIATPEITDQVIANRGDRLDEALEYKDHPGIDFFCALANELDIHLLIGSMCIKVAKDKIANRSFLFGPEGRVVESYDKIHLYDVDLPGGESYRESRTFCPGKNLALADIGEVKLGMTICYDVRFPHIYRALAKAGAQMVSIPAAFTVPSGEAHWHVLMRARAIECGMFVIAPAQVGDHQGARKTYGHSNIIGPWGEILAEREEDSPGIITAELNLNDVEKARSAIPALYHDRDFIDILRN